MRKAVAIVSILAILAVSGAANAADRIILVRTGQTDEAMWSTAKKYFAGKGFSVAAYEQARTVEKQIETANRINKEKARFMLVLEIVASDQPGAFVATTDVKKAKGLILNADEVPGTHAARSEELGSSIAARFQRKAKSAPLFVFMGIDLPAVFVRLNVAGDRSTEAFDALYDGVLNFTKRGNRDERELKGQRPNSAAED